MSRKKDGATVVGLGAAACAACCAGPILGVLAAIGLTTFAGVLLFAAGLLIAFLAIVVVIRRRRMTAKASCRTSMSVHLGQWQGLAPTGRQMRIDEVYFFRVDHGRVVGLWGLEDTWTRMQQLAGADATLGELGSLT